MTNTTTVKTTEKRITLFYNKTTRHIYDSKGDIVAFNIKSEKGFFPTLEPKTFTTYLDAITWVSVEGIDCVLVSA